MRVMVMVKATSQSEAGEMPGTALLEAMGNFNGELVKAGMMLAGKDCTRAQWANGCAFQASSGP